jgi:hypothetical protein
MVLQPITLDGTVPLLVFLENAFFQSKNTALNENERLQARMKSTDKEFMGIGSRSTSGTKVNRNQAIENRAAGKI